MDGDAALLFDPNPAPGDAGRPGAAAAAGALRLWLRDALRRRRRFVELAEDGAGAHARAGLALLVAARLEPHAAPGAILVTGQFVDAWRELLGAGGFEARAVEPREVADAAQSDGRYDLAKPGGEAPMLRGRMVLEGPAPAG